MNYFVRTLLAGALFSVVACGDAATDCGTPQPFFSENIEGITGHSFEVKELYAVEKASIPQYDFSIEVHQSGCEEVTQEFRFYLEGEVAQSITPAECTEIAARLFTGLSQLSPDLMDFTAWSDALMRAQPRVQQFNQSVPLDDARYAVEINKMHEASRFVLFVTLKGRL